MLAFTSPSLAPAAITCPTQSPGNGDLLAVSLAGSGDDVVLTFDRANVGAVVPAFSLDPTHIDVSLYDPQHDREVRLVARREAPVVSSVAHDQPSEADPSVGDDVARIAYRIDPNVTPDLYCLRVRMRPSDSRAHPEVATFAFEPSSKLMYVTNAADRTKTIERLRRKFVRHTVYGYGGSLAIACSTTEGESGYNVPSAEIVSIDRDPQLNQSMTFGSKFAFRSNDFLDVFPIRIVFADIAGPASFGFVASDSSQTHGESHMAHPGLACARPTMDVSGSWDFTRSLTLRTAAQHLEWSAHYRRAIASGMPIVGMSPEIVAYIMGYPSIYGTAVELARLPEWAYPVAMAGNSMIFFKNGRVDAVDLSRPGPDM